MSKASPQPLSSTASGPAETLSGYPSELRARLLDRLSPSARLEGLEGAAAAFVFSLYHQESRRPLVWVCKSNQELDETAQDFLYFLGAEGPSRVLVLPGHESDPYRGLSPHPGLAARRAGALARLQQGFDGILVTSLGALAQKTVSPEEFRNRRYSMKLGERVSRDQLISELRGIGYVREDPVSEPGEFSFRGGIVDVFSPASDHPLRIEFFGDEIESIRRFDPSTQRSVGMVPEAEVIPMREICPTEEQIRQWHAQAPDHWNEVRFADTLSEYFQFTENCELFNGFEFLFPLVIPTPATPLDFMEQNGNRPIVVLPDSEEVETRLKDRWRKASEAHEDCLLQGIPSLPPERFFLSTVEMIDLFHSRPHFHLEVLKTSDPESQTAQEGQPFGHRPAERYQGKIQDLLTDLERWKSRSEQVVFVMPSEGMAHRLADLFREYDVPISQARDFQGALKAGIAVTSGRISGGFQLRAARLHVLTDEEVFGKLPEMRGAARPRSDALGSFISDFRDLHDGDYVVHIDHGIGVFRGLQRIGVGDQSNEFVLLEYSGGAKLFVPIDRLELIQKYSSAGAAAPQVDRLGGTSWTKSKTRIKKSMRDLAEDLLKLYAHREVAQGHAFAADDALMKEFEESFPFEETPDQRAAIKACKRDMENERPMDRLICGDVGYGKTEVAMRAAFKAVNDGKQVALLAPTTVLTFQHFNTFRERFKSFPVRIEMLSRFLNREEQREVLEQTQLGLVDIVVGTHRMLSRDVRFADLGLIVVDEEQRFGVAQKERLKKLKAQVDVLTLSATPIPRTLNMSMIGIRDISIIETAPKDRLSIQTVVVRYSTHMIRSAIDLELKRSGQVFFLHNSVETIHSMARTIADIVPEARIGVAHGQMSEDQLENVMLDFLNHRFDVLVCTTIIENGLDIPRANTIIINHAHRFGLSQLYQLRGRVGRSNRRAYAYLLISGEDILSGDARRRLAAIREFSDLGSGFRLAALDLEIRGAGNLLGGEQSGHIQSVGFELYVKLLEEAVRELKGEPPTEDLKTTIDLRLDIQIPEHYLADPNLRLWVYKRVSAAPSGEKLAALEEELTDCFGRHPRAVANLFTYARLRLVAQPLRLSAIERKGSQVYFRFRPDTPLSPHRALNLVQSDPGLSFSTDGSLVASIASGSPLEILTRVSEVIDRLLQEL